MGTTLDRGDVQAIVLGPYKYPLSRHLLFQFGSGEGGRAFLAALLPSVTHGDQVSVGSGEPLVNLGITWTGLLALGAFDDVGGPEAVETEFYVFALDPDPESLRLSAASAPPTWWHGAFASRDIHASVHLHTLGDEALEETTRTVRAAARDAGVRELVPGKDRSAITGRAVDGRKLHFGYEDGISHPEVNWDDEPGRPDLVPRERFLLGGQTRGPDPTPGARSYAATVRNGTFMAFAWMYQDVARFNRFLREEGARLAPHLPPKDAEEWLAAKMMGRWRDGTPLALSPDRSDGSLKTANDFGYADDPSGLKCPLAAHVRLANGRDQPFNQRNGTMFADGFPLVLRRGTPYGFHLDGEEDDGADRGTVGLFLCSNLNRQFYSLTRWLGRTNFTDLNANSIGQDPISADRAFPGASNDFDIPSAEGSKTLVGLPDFVRMQGVAFFLLPGLEALRGLVRGSGADTRSVGRR